LEYPEYKEESEATGEAGIQRGINELAGQRKHTHREKSMKSSGFVIYIGVQCYILRIYKSTFSQHLRMTTST